MLKGFSWPGQRVFVNICLLLFLLVFVLVACADNGGASPGSNVSNTQSNNGSSSQNNASNGNSGPVSSVHMGVQTCPSAVSTKEYWDPIVPSQAGINKVENVTCANLKGNASIQALISVRSFNPGASLDIYVFDNITQPNPQKIFMLLGLYKGQVKVSAYSTLLTGEVDQQSSVNKNQLNSALKVDLFREFKWSAQANTLVPINFPGIYPVLSRYEAEDLQQQVNQGNQPLLDASKVALNLATDQNLLGWSSDSVASVDSGGGKNDANAVVTVKSASDGNNKIKVSLSRLEGNTNGGIWIVTGVTSDGLSISTPVSQDIVSNPVKVSGQGGGSVQVLDHLYNEIGSSTVTGQANFSTSVDYKKTFQGGVENGLVVLYGGNGATATGVVMVKELLG